MRVIANHGGRSAGQDTAGMTTRLTVAVGIASAGRRDVLAQTLLRLRQQDRLPDRVIVCCPTHDDLAGVAAQYPGVSLTVSPRGLPRQRNAILDAAGGADILLFLDDDFVPARDYLAHTEETFLAHPEVVMTTGRVLADGIRGRGITFAEADALVSDPVEQADVEADLVRTTNGYGCNMALRMAPVREHGLRFDENLPLYGWLEDVDFGMQLRCHGAVVRLESARGVHLGVKSGRQSGLRLGYSQIANPIYLLRKGTCPPGKAANLISRNVAGNVLRAARPEAYVDRRGRLLGNLRALGDFVTGRLHPTRITSL